jgi:hypothetical protein
MPDGTYGGVRGQVGDITLTFLLDLPAQKEDHLYFGLYGIGLGSGEAV